MEIAAWMFAFLAAVVCAFQLALSAGAPWGRLTMGGRIAGRLPPLMRISALAQALFLAFLAFVVLARAGLAFPGLFGASKALAWLAVGVSALSFAANILTPSKWERIAWAPVGVALTACSVLVALG